MIFITLGSQKFQFNRLLKYVDNIIETEGLFGDVFAQIGASDYRPRNYQYVDYLNREEFQKKMNESNVLITHAGTGAIISGLKNGAYVIAVPRKKEFGEHVDDHQYEIADAFQKSGYIQLANNENDLRRCLEFAFSGEVYKKKFESNTKAYLDFISKKFG